LQKIAKQGQAQPDNKFNVKQCLTYYSFKIIKLTVLSSQIKCQKIPARGASAGLPTKNSARTIVGRNKYRGDGIVLLARVKRQLRDLTALFKLCQILPLTKRDI